MRRLFLFPERADDLARERDTLGLGVDRVICRAGNPRVDIGAAELIGGHVLAGCRLDKRRPAEEHTTDAAHHDRVVGERRDVRATRGAMSQHDSHLWHAQRGELALVSEHAPAAVFAGEDPVLHRQKRSRGVYQVHDGQPVLYGDVERADGLRYRMGEPGAALDRAVARDHHHFAPGHHAVAYGLAAAALGWEPVAAATAYLYSTTALLTGAALRLLSMGQMEGQRVLWALHPVIERVAQEAAARDAGDLWSFAHGIEIAGIRHAALEMRLFRS